MSILKHIFFAVFLGSVFLLSCQSTEKRYDNIENTMTTQHFGAIYSETEEGFYFNAPITKRYLYYYNHANTHVGALCGKPECTHDTTDCNAFLGTEESELVQGIGLSVQKDGIYYLLNDGIHISVYFMQSDGSAHRKIRDLTAVENNTYPLSAMCQPVFHHGYVFACGNVTEIVNGEYQIVYRIMAYPLAEKETELTIFSGTAEAGLGGILMMPVGDDLYYAVTEVNIDDENELHPFLSLSRWDLESRSSSTVYEGELPSVPYEWYFDDRGIWFTSASDQRIFYLDLEEKCFNTHDFGGADSGFATEYFCNDQVIGFQYPSSDIMRIRIETLDGEEVSDFTTEKIPVEKGHSGRIFLQKNQDQLYFLYYSENGRFCSLIVCDINYGSQQILWTEEN